MLENEDHVLSESKHQTPLLSETSPLISVKHSLIQVVNENTICNDNDDSSRDLVKQKLNNLFWDIKTSLLLFTLTFSAFLIFNYY